jgi:hypothetical protein
MDTTYVWELWWLMLFRLREQKNGTRNWRTILRYRVWASETNDRYRKWVRELLSSGVKILWVIADGRRWLLSSFQSISVQMCHFHMKAIVRRNIGKHPRLDQHKQLKEIVEVLWKLRPETLQERLKSRETVHKEWLKEKNEEENRLVLKWERLVQVCRHQKVPLTQTPRIAIKPILYRYLCRLEIFD